MGRHIFETVIGAIVLIVAIGFLYFAYSSTHVNKGGGYLLMAKFDKADGVVIGSDVRISGVKVGSVTRQELDPQTYLAKVWFSIDKSIKLPEDSSAEIVSDGLLGGKYVSLVPGAEEIMLKSGDEIKFTQSAINLETLIGKYIFGGTKKDEGEDKKESAPATDAPKEGGAKEGSAAPEDSKKNPFATGL